MTNTNSNYQMYLRLLLGSPGSSHAELTFADNVLNVLFVSSSSILTRGMFGVFLY